MYVRANAESVAAFERDNRRSDDISNPCQHCHGRGWIVAA
jgi:hypothetical protein